MQSTIDACVVSQGEELLTGLTLDTNAQLLCERLTGLGLRVRGVLTAGDDEAAIAQILREAAIRGRVVICTGGLGPTGDDLTAVAVVRAFGGKLAVDATAMAQVEARFARLGRPMNESNRKQALLPIGCLLLENKNGTAPGFSVATPQGGRAYFLPGVPREMRPMLDELVLPDVTARFAPPAPQRALFRVMGRGESELEMALGDVPRRFADVELGFQAKMPEVHVKLTARPGLAGFGEAAAHVRGILGQDCFSEDPDEELAGCIGRLLMARGERLALAESCTGGWIAHLVVTEAGSSRWFERGWVTYSNEAKTQDLGVPVELLARYGAVSEEVARAMAEGARRAASVAWGVGVTGVAGPSGGTESKPVGTVCVAVAGPDGTHARTLRFGRDRTSNRRFAAGFGLELLRRQLLRRGDGEEV